MVVEILSLLLGEDPPVKFAHLVVLRRLALVEVVTNTGQDVIRKLHRRLSRARKETRGTASLVVITVGELGQRLSKP